MIFFVGKRTGSYVAIERLTMITAMILIMNGCFANHYKISLLFGLRPEVVWQRQYFSDSTNLLSLDAIITTVHLFIPLRSYIIWLIPVTGCMVYGCLTLSVGGPELDNLSFFEGLR